MLYFMAEQIALQSGADTASLEAAVGGNMNTATAVVVTDEKGVEGLSENFKNTYKVGENKIVN